MDEVMSMGNELIGKVGDNSSIFLAGTYRPSMAALIVTIVVGLLICLFGLKLMRLLAAVVGFVLGAAAGVAAAVAMGLTGTTFLIAVLAGAVIIGLLSIFLRRIGIFLLVLCYGFGVCAAVIHPSSMIMYIICLGIAVVLAVLSVLYLEPIVVVVTGISGGLCAGMAAASLMGMEKNILVGYGISIVLAVAGIIVQFMMHSRKIGKKEEVYSKKVKEEVSRESEVEKARMILEEDEEDEVSAQEESDDDIEIIEEDI